MKMFSLVNLRRKHQECFKAACWLLEKLPTFFNPIFVWQPSECYCARFLSWNNKNHPMEPEDEHQLPKKVEQMEQWT